MCVYPSCYNAEKMPRNYDPTLHPFEVPREYTRALNATKLERVDGISCITKHAKSLSTIISGACDGEVKVWNLPKRECLRTVQAHEGYVRGICSRFCGTSFFTVGDDKTIKQWNMEAPGYGVREEPGQGTAVFTGIDHHQREGTFVTCGQVVDIWDEQRSSPIRSFSWGVDSFSCVPYNPVELKVLHRLASNRSIVLYDTRESAPLRKVIMQLRSNTLYTCDIRNLDVPVNVHMDHVSAVLDVDYSLTGREFVSASFDKTAKEHFPSSLSLSLSPYRERERMSIRLWKANASEKLGLVKKAAANYNKKLIEKFQHHPQVKRIARHRHLPRDVLKQKRELREMKEARRRKEQNVHKHSKPGSVPLLTEKEKHVVAVVE
uniref:Ddb1 and cul4 associated factor 13 n=1 Tax=Sinocyclocheilus rhinocerous TaxID=307959 RepID=A0A673ILQ4_9TELE